MSTYEHRAIGAAVGDMYAAAARLSGQEGRPDDEVDDAAMADALDYLGEMCRVLAGQARWRAEKPGGGR